MLGYNYCGFDSLSGNVFCVLLLFFLNNILTPFSSKKKTPMLSFIYYYFNKLCNGGQVVTMISSMSLIGLLPESKFRRFLGAIAYQIAIRTLMRSMSCVTNFHDTQYMPRSNGFCVANHTSPIDVGTLSVNTCFSLVGLVEVLPALGLMCFVFRVNHCVRLFSGLFSLDLTFFFYWNCVFWTGIS